MNREVITIPKWSISRKDISTVHDAIMRDTHRAVVDAAECAETLEMTLRQSSKRISKFLREQSEHYIRRIHDLCHKPIKNNPGLEQVRLGMLAYADAAERYLNEK